MASWIEMELSGAVDDELLVEAYVASWIEITQYLLRFVPLVSRLMWPRGLKLCFAGSRTFTKSRGLCGLVD